MSERRDVRGDGPKPGRGCVTDAGEALVCLGCGRVEYFMQSFESVLEHPGATEVHAEAAGPYR